MFSLKQIFFCLFIYIVNSTKCLNNQGQEVFWWVMLITPNTTTAAHYAYYDSTKTNSDFQLFTIQPSDQNSALGRTLTQINTLKLQSLAWNDEKPNGSTSSTSAHSKTVIAINTLMAHGFMIVHSMPKYPAFVDNKVDITIGDSQRIYGQHAFCFTQTVNIINQIAEGLQTIKPYIYHSNILSNPQYVHLSALASQLFVYPEAHFQYYQFSNAALKAKVIFKNGNNSKNSSIFEDGLNHYLKSPIVAETWGRPLDADWCGSPQVHSSQKITISPTVNWPYTKDHSKWVIATSSATSCFGDMNRQSSQWKRGGVFYCVQNNSGLHAALSKYVSYQPCSHMSQIETIF